jgi:tetratricopeptide (TPR) repeat protein
MGPTAQKPEKVAAAAREALEELGELVDECRRFRLSLHGAASAAMAAEVHLGSGDAEAADGPLRLAVELYHDGGAPWSAATAELNLSQLARSRGDLAAAERYGRAAVEHNLDPELRVLDACWDEDEWKPVIAQAARAYGSSLMAVDDPRRAAQLLLSTAERVSDWPNQVPHAMMAGDAATALERAGRYVEAAAAFRRAADRRGLAGDHRRDQRPATARRRGAR